MQLKFTRKKKRIKFFIHEYFRTITKINIPPESEVSFSVGVGFANDARTAATLSFTAVGKNVVEMAGEKELFYNKLLL